MQRTWLLPLALLGACKVSPEAPPVFSDPMLATFTEFDAEEAVLAGILRDLEGQIYANMEVDSKDVVKRSASPAALTEADVDHLEGRPDRDPSLALAVATIHASAFEVADHALIPVQDDQRPLEPASPEHYDREFFEGKDCWQPRDCDWLTTFQDLTKVYTANIIPPITYSFFKDFRWVDLSAGTDDPEPRWAFVARSWNDDSYASENGKNTIWQAYTLEVWFPRDSRGFRWDEADGEPAGPDAGDSTKGGTLRLLLLWTETEIALSDDDNTVIGTIRWGMDRNYKAHDAWLEEHAER